MTFSIPANSVQTEIEIKKSRFITRVGFVSSRTAAMAMLQQAKVDYPDARHHCWAYVIGAPDSPKTAAMSDDGEPSGTAGKPILNVLQHKQIGNIMLIVIRYFGGIKLGAGGLVRAYSAAAQTGIDELEIKREVPMCEFTVTTDFANEQYIRHWLTQNKGLISKVEYSDTVSLALTLPLTKKDEFVTLLGPISNTFQQTKQGQQS
ncbi:YigZ family protein [Alteromonas sp. ASW11-130]|uniref:YigZ family protein n=1 Tax=Alteromonas sp. ASW11-130 TaxID=3015775 RepID=UPI002241BFF6|nr:YigZ family protein [Alteromonas sp. ASW11-130]MCW8092742.1 YigZ family protein [Alteromonas sp. ASW11-130]